jgi:phenylalanyl-tRNA synthetase alpha chain
MPLLEDIAAIRETGLRELQAADTPQALEAWRVQYLGLKGLLKTTLARLREVPPDQKAAAGKAANELKNALQAAFDQRQAAAPPAPKARAGPTPDITLPGRRPALGHAHVLTQTIHELCDIFGRMGFSVAYGPEVEDEWHNFVALNIPAAHPARDPLDNFYIDPQRMLRSQTSTVQIRVMETQKPPVRIVAPGRVYRPDTVDATHGVMFHQIEGLYVDEGVTMTDLRTCLDQFAKAYFGERVATRFRPSFFPFTEPSAEVDMSCPLCGGAKCAICKQTGWIELGGCGMVDPNVFDAVGYDSQIFTGFAFGLGIERMVMGKHGIPDLRLLLENDVRFLRQF